MRNGLRRECVPPAELIDKLLIACVGDARGEIEILDPKVGLGIALSSVHDGCDSSPSMPLSVVKAAASSCSFTGDVYDKDRLLAPCICALTPVLSGDSLRPDLPLCDAHVLRSEGPPRAESPLKRLLSFGRPMCAD